MGRTYRFKTTPRNYQVRALKKALKNRGSALFMPMRSGKSKVAIDWAGVLHIKHGVKRVLIITHSPTTFGVWKNEIRKHCPIPYTIKLGVDGDIVEWTDKGSDSKITFWILNVQNVYSRKREGKSWEVVDNKRLYKWKPQAIIVDESTTLGNPSSVQSRHAYRLQKALAPYKLLLTGTPAHKSKNVIGMFGQFKFMDDSIFGTSIGAYKAQYGLWGGWNKYVLLKVINVKLWRKKIEPFVYQLIRVPYRPPINQVVPVELSDSEQRAYADMASTSIFTTPGGNEISAPIILTRLLKEAQLACGWIKDDDGKWHQTGTSVRDAYRDVLDKLKESEVSRVVVFARHLPELKDAAMVAKNLGYKPILLHGKVPHNRREERISDFHEPGGYKAFISQVSTGSMGIDLSVADTCIYYSLTESVLHKDQADARIRKHGDKRALTYYYLIPKGTVIEDMYMALQSKMDLIDFVMKHPQLVHRRERG